VEPDAAIPEAGSVGHLLPSAALDRQFAPLERAAEFRRFSLEHIEQRRRRVAVERFPVLDPDFPDRFEIAPSLRSVRRVRFT
jgi:hypothetical protein